MKKTPAKKKPPAPKRRRRVRHPNPKVPTSGPWFPAVDDMVETTVGMVLVEMIRKVGIKPTHILTALNLLTQTKESNTACACGGECLCHCGIQIAAVPCPPDCPNIGTRFDGCHRCDCGKPT